MSMEASQVSGVYRLARDKPTHNGNAVYRKIRKSHVTVDNMKPIDEKREIAVEFFIYFNDDNRWVYGEDFESIEGFQSAAFQQANVTSCPTDDDIQWELFDENDWVNDTAVEVFCSGITKKEISEVVEELVGLIVYKEATNIANKIEVITNAAVEILKEELVNIKEAIIEGNNPSEVKISIEDNKEDEYEDNTFYVGHNSVSSPKESYGVIALDPNYRKRFPHENGTNVSVSMEILGITKIDSLSKVVGLEIDICMGWEDRRINWTQGGPQPKQGLQFSSSVLQ